MSGKHPVRPTRRQLEVLGYIREYIRRHDRAPTIQELCDGLALGRKSVQRYLGALEHYGCIQRKPGRWRQIEVMW